MSRPLRPSPLRAPFASAAGAAARGLALAAAVLAAGCRTTTAPEWIAIPTRHDRCDEAISMCGVGSAEGHDDEAREQARQRALKDIAESIRVEVTSTARVDLRSETGDGATVWEESLDEVIEVASSAALVGVDEIESFVDARGDLHVLLAASRKANLDALLPQAHQALAAAEEAFGRGEGLESGEPVRALDAYVRAHEHVTRAYGASLTAAVIGAPSRWADAASRPHGRASTLLATLSARIERVLARLRVSLLEGDGQHGRVGGELARPLRARFSFVGPDGVERPAAGLPVHVATEPPGAAVLAPSSDRTDERGEITVVVSDLLPTGSASNAVTLAPRLDQQALARAAPVWRFTYGLPTPGGTRVLVALRQSLERRPLDAGLPARLGSYLSRRGFAVEVHEDPDAVLALDAADLAGLLGGDHDVVLRGEAAAWPSSREGQLHWYRASARLELVDLVDGRVTSLTTGEVKQAHTQPGTIGARRALARLDAELRATVEARFVRRFLPAAE